MKFPCVPQLNKVPVSLILDFSVTWPAIPLAESPALLGPCWMEGPEGTCGSLCGLQDPPRIPAFLVLERPGPHQHVPWPRLAPITFTGSSGAGVVQLRM